MTINPHADTGLARYVRRRVSELQSTKTQAEIAAEAGYVNPNMITMIKQGQCRLALDRVPRLARALDCDPAHLMRLALEQAIGPVAARAILETLGEPVTHNERAWLRQIRKATENGDPPVTSGVRQAIREILRPVGRGMSSAG